MRSMRAGLAVVLGRCSSLPLASLFVRRISSSPPYPILAVSALETRLSSVISSSYPRRRQSAAAPSFSDHSVELRRRVPLAHPPAARLDWQRVRSAYGAVHRRRFCGVRATEASDSSSIGSPMMQAMEKKRYIFGIPLVDNVPSNIMAIGCKRSTLFIITHSITTQVSVKQENVVKALELFISTKKDEAISVKEICTIYIDKLCRSGNLSEAAYLLRHLHSRAINVCLNTYNILLTAAVESNNFNLFSEVFKSLLISNLPPDITSYNKVAEAFQKVADSDLVLDFIRDVSAVTIGTDPTVINRIIFVTAKFGQIDKSLMIFEVLKNLNSKMDTVTFNTVLGILGKAGQINEMMSEFMVMKYLGHVPDIVTYSTLINCLRRFGRLDLCKTIASEMFEKGIEMDLLTYTALVDVFGRAGHVEDALRTFEEMKKFHHPSIYVCRSIISNLKKVGKFELALCLSAEMNLSTTKLAGPEDFKQKRKSRMKIKQVG